MTGTRIVICSPLPEGGIAGHAYFQASAMVRAGINRTSPTARHSQ